MTLGCGFVSTIYLYVFAIRSLSFKRPRPFPFQQGFMNGVWWRDATERDLR